MAKKRVIHSGRCIGEIEDSGDPLRNAGLAKDVAIKAGVCHAEDRARVMFRHAVAFWNVAKNICETDLPDVFTKPQVLPPFVVNAAFAVEMYLKCLHQAHDQPKRGHGLIDLFEALPPPVKERLGACATTLAGQYGVKGEQPFGSHLEHLDAAFVKWRYIYEEMQYIEVQTVVFVAHVLHQTAVEELGDTA